MRLQRSGCKLIVELAFSNANNANNDITLSEMESCARSCSFSSCQQLCRFQYTNETCMAIMLGIYCPLFLYLRMRRKNRSRSEKCGRNSWTINAGREQGSSFLGMLRRTSFNARTLAHYSSAFQVMFCSFQRLGSEWSLIRVTGRYLHTVVTV